MKLSKSIILGLLTFQIGTSFAQINADFGQFSLGVKGGRQLIGFPLYLHPNNFLFRCAPLAPN